MDLDLLIRTMSPIFLLMGLGMLSRKVHFLKSGDERVFSAYVYYFALPALFLIKLAETNFTVGLLSYIFAGILPILVAVAILLISFRLFRFSKKMLYLLMLSATFGSLSFFGIPYISFAFPMSGEGLATIASAFISPVSVIIAITILELYAADTSTIWNALQTVLMRLTRNPLVLSIISGLLLSFSPVPLPSPLSASLHMMGSTTSTVAIFMLGVFLYGRKYTKKMVAFKLSLLRIVFLPLVALLTTGFFNLHGLEQSVLVLMHAMPVAISMIVLSERYAFFPDIVPSLILFSSLGGTIMLNLWLLLLSIFTG